MSGLQWGLLQAGRAPGGGTAQPLVLVSQAVRPCPLPISLRCLVASGGISEPQLLRALGAQSGHWVP